MLGSKAIEASAEGVRATGDALGMRICVINYADVQQCEGVF
jgi:hypothetical protein